MIYFMQDEGTLYIKIGYTDGDPAKRLASLQTGNASKLRLITTIPGDQALERTLHQRFDAWRVAGEWFRPCHQLLSLLIDSKARIAPRAPRRSPPYTFYLAGKIKSDGGRGGKDFDGGWRQDLVRLNLEQYGLSGKEPVVEHGVIFEQHHFCGPWFFDSSSGHGTYLREGQHGNQVLFDVEPRLLRDSHTAIRSYCFASIDLCDVLFAWIDSLDAYGTITEIGYAHARGRRVWISWPLTFNHRDMWLPLNLAEQSFPYQSAPAALRFCLAHDAGQVALDKELGR